MQNNTEVTLQVHDYRGDGGPCREDGCGRMPHALIHQDWFHDMSDRMDANDRERVTARNESPLPACGIAGCEGAHEPQDHNAVESSPDERAAVDAMKTLALVGFVCLPADNYCALIRQCDELRTEVPLILAWLQNKMMDDTDHSYVVDRIMRGIEGREYRV